MYNTNEGGIKIPLLELCYLEKRRLHINFPSKLTMDVIQVRLIRPQKRVTTAELCSFSFSFRSM